MATGVYKAIHEYKVPTGIGELLHERDQLIMILEENTPSSYPKINTTTFGLKSWRYSATKIWKTLPDQFRAADKIGTFKNLMSMFDFTNFTF